MFFLLALRIFLIVPSPCLCLGLSLCWKNLNSCSAETNLICYLFVAACYNLLSQLALCEKWVPFFPARWYMMCYIKKVFQIRLCCSQSYNPACLSKSSWGRLGRRTEMGSSFPFEKKQGLKSAPSGWGLHEVSDTGAWVRLPHPGSLWHHPSHLFCQRPTKPAVLTRPSVSCVGAGGLHGAF